MQDRVDTDPPADAADVSLLDVNMAADAASGWPRRSIVRRRYLGACAVGAVVVWLLFALIVTYGRFDFFHVERFGGFYDAQAHALDVGHLDVPADDLRFEGFRVRGETHMYQGLVPAIARLPVTVFTDALDGRLTGVSMALGFAVAMAYVVRTSWRVRTMVRGNVEARRSELIGAGALTFGIGASSMLFLASKAWIYHEALLWGAALTLASLSHLLDWLAPDIHRAPVGSAVHDRAPDGEILPRSAEETAPGSVRGSVRPLVLSAAFAFLAIHTRLSVGFAAVAALASVGAAILVGRMVERRESWSTRWTRLMGWGAPTDWVRPVIVLLVAVVVSLGSYAFVNYARFGTLFGIPIDKQVLVGFDTGFQQALADNGGSLFGIKYTPSVAWQLVRPDVISFDTTFPFVGFPGTRPSALGDVAFAQRDWSSSLPLSQPLLFLGAVLGVVALVIPRRFSGEGRTAAARLPVAGAAVAVAGIGVIGYIANRYQADLWPFLALTALVGVHAVASRAARSSSPVPVRASWPIWLTVGVVVLASWGGWVNASLAMEYQRVMAPGAWDDSRGEWIRLQAALGVDPDIRTYDADDPLPPPGPAGQVLMDPSCRATYVSNGDLWYLVEGDDTGRFEGDLVVGRVLTEPVTLLEAQGPEGTNRLVVEPVDGPRAVRLAVETERAGEPVRSIPGPPFPDGAGEPIPIRTEMDWRTGYVQVTSSDRAVNDGELYGATVDGMVPASPEVTGEPEVRLDVTPIGTPLCDALAPGSG